VTHLHTSDKHKVKHYVLKGRVTKVFHVTSKTLAKGFQDAQEDVVVAKIFWVEEQRTSESEILKKVYQQPQTQMR
jgi:hypothetical protein